MFRSHFYKVVEGQKFFIIGVFCLTVLLIGWMSIAEIDQVVRVEGKIIPAGRSQQIQHLEGGIVSKIEVQEGALVHKGDLLLTIDSTQAGASLSETKSKLDSELGHAARLKAEVAGEGKITFPDELKNASIMDAETNLFQARRNKLNQDISVHKALLSQRMAEYQEAKDRKVRLSPEMGTATERLNIVEGMAKNGAASKLEVLDARSREQGLKTDLGDIDSALPKLEGGIAEEHMRIDQANSDFKADAQNELVSTLAQIDSLRQIVMAANDRMKRTDIRAPVDGIINSVSVNTVGGVVKPGEDLIEITPLTDKVLIEARAQPRDRGYLQPDLKSEIRVSTYDPAQFGMLQGHVTKVGADSVQDSRNESYYQVDIVVDSISDRYQGHEMVPGMTVTADIVTGHRTILGYLLSPLRKFTYNMFRDPR